MSSFLRVGVAGVLDAHPRKADVQTDTQTRADFRTCTVQRQGTGQVSGYPALNLSWARRVGSGSLLSDQGPTPTPRGTLAVEAHPSPCTQAALHEQHFQCDTRPSAQRWRPRVLCWCRWGWGRGATPGSPGLPPSQARVFRTAGPQSQCNIRITFFKRTFLKCASLRNR